MTAYLTASDAQTVTTAIQLVADKLHTDAGSDAGPGDQGSADQCRADAFAAICQAVLDGHTLFTDSTRPVRHGRHATIQVTVALSTLLDLDQQPGELAGYGPIDADTARQLAADPTSTWYRLIHDPHGHLIDYGRTRRPPPQLGRRR